MLDLAVINGFVFIEGGFRKADIGIKNGKFALIAEAGICQIHCIRLMLRENM